MATSNRLGAGGNRLRPLADRLADMDLPGKYEPDPPTDVDTAFTQFRERVEASDFPLVDDEAMSVKLPGSHGPQTNWLRIGIAACLVLAVTLAVAWFVRSPRAEAATVPPLDYQVDIYHLDRDRSAAEASTALRKLSDLALAQPATLAAGPVQRNDSYTWTVDATVDQTGVHLGFLNAQLRTFRMFPDGSSESTERKGPRFNTSGKLPPSPSQAIQTAPSTTDLTLPGTFDATFAQRLSTNPEVLRQQLLEAMGPTTPDNPATDALVLEISNLHDIYVIDSRLEAAMWQVLAGQPDLHYGGQISDRLGNTVQAILSLGPTGNITALLIDTKTGALTGYEMLIPNQDVKSKDSEPLIIGILVAYLSHDWTKDPEPAPTETPQPGEGDSQTSNSPEPSDSPTAPDS